MRSRSFGSIETSGIGARVVARALLGQDAEAGAGDDRHRARLDRVLAVAEEDEVVLEQPVEERDRLLDLVGRVARRRRRARPRPCTARARASPRSRAPTPGRRRGPRGRGRTAPSARPARAGARARSASPTRARRPRGACRTSTMRPSASRSTPITGWITSRTAEAAGVELRRHRVDQERRVGRVRLEHRARQRVAVGLQRRVERAHRERRGAAAVGEVEHADDLAEQLLGRQPGEERRPTSGAGRPRRRCAAAVPWLPSARDARVQLADDGTLRGAHV